MEKTNRRKMSNEERLNDIIAELERFRKYKAFLYKTHIITWIVIVVLPVFFTIELELWRMNIVYGIANLIFFILMIGLFFYLYWLIPQKRRKNKVKIEANFNKDEIGIIPPSPSAIHSCASYSLVAYYVKDLNTYRFHCTVRDNQMGLYPLINRLLDEGEIPKVPILVDPQNYNKYIMLGYDFIQELLRVNYELVCDEFDDFYGTKWKYIKVEEKETVG